MKPQDPTKPMSPETQVLCALARRIMGSEGGAHVYDAGIGRVISNYGWDEEDVRRVIGATDDVLWIIRVAELAAREEAVPSFYTLPEGVDDDGQYSALEGWRDQPLEALADMNITGAGVIVLAMLYDKEATL
jgi:hypothetical protein